MVGILPVGILALWLRIPIAEPTPGTLVSIGKEAARWKLTSLPQANSYLEHYLLYLSDKYLDTHNDYTIICLILITKLS